MTNCIRSYREKHGMTLEAFGELVGVQKGTVHRWENGISPSLDSARAIEERTAGTEGAITRQQLRPDVWSTDSSPTPFEEVAA